MLISHHHRFVFVKPRKTAGTTVELALSPWLGPGDLATPVAAAEEALRAAAPGVRVGRIAGRGRFGQPVSLRDHSSLARAETVLGSAIAGYRVVTMARNPWDRAVSQFFWSMRDTDMRHRPAEEQIAAFRRFTRRWGPSGWLDRVYGRKRQRKLDNADLYFDGDRCRADFVIRFEHLGPDLAALGDWLGLAGQPQVTLRTKSGLRGGGPGWRIFHDAATRDLVARECTREIALIGYAFDTDAPRHGPRITAPQGVA